MFELNQVSVYQGGGVQNDPSMAGFSAARRNAQGAHRRRVLEAARLYADVLTGREEPYFLKQAIMPTNEVFVRYLAEKYPGLYGDPGGRMLGLQETMSITDYQALYVDVLDRMYYGYYNAFPIYNKPLFKIHPLRDFRLVSRYLLDGVVTPLTAMDPAAPPQQRALVGPVPQGGATQATASTAPIQYQPLLYQAMTAVNWKAFVNDDLGIFQDLANRLAIAANRGISKFLTSFYMQSSGPNVNLYKAAYRNLITTAYGASSNNPPLSIQGLQDGYKILANMLDSGGDPIFMDRTKAIVWYGPEYAATAENLRNMLTAQIQVEGGTSNAQGYPAQFVQVNNWAVKNLQWVMDPYIPVVSSSKPLSWGITLDPNSQARPSVEAGFLNGFETPQIFSKVPNTQRLGGGLEPQMGDFYSMDQELKIVTVMGGAIIDGRSTVASNGSGS